MSKRVPTILILLLVSLPASTSVRAQRAQRQQPRIAAPTGAQSGKPVPELQAFEGQYYVIHSSLDKQRVREAELRMSRMAEEYHRRTRDFAGAIRSKFPFYLYETEQDYLAGGGMRGTAGCFNPNANVLMAFDAGDAELWHTVQHEGFHQFASAVIGGELPIWLNEGLADYFGEGLFTGDSFVIGVIPEWRRRRIMKSLNGEGDQSFQPIERLLYMNHATWNDQMSLANYDQAWSIVHFLVHGNDGKYQKPFAAFIRAISSGRPWERAWQDNLGSASGFEARWKEYWSGLPENPTEDLYVQATMRSLMNFLARAHLQQKDFADFHAFATAAASGDIFTLDRDWLPTGVLLAALKHAERLQKNGYSFELLKPGANGRTSKLPELRCTSPAGAESRGRFTLRSGRTGEVSITPMRLPAAATTVRSAPGRSGK